MNRAVSRPSMLALALLLLPAGASATLTFTQLDDDVFVVSHRVKLIGSRGKATEMVFTKAASLCEAAGYSHLRVLDQESEAAQEEAAANATVRVRFFLEDGDDRLRCAAKSDPVYRQEAREKLAKRGYRPPAPTAAAEAPAAAGGDGGATCPEGCTLEQIAAMARTGLSDEQIRAACGG